jgi:hypothetical protein
MAARFRGTRDPISDDVLKIAASSSVALCAGGMSWPSGEGRPLLAQSGRSLNVGFGTTLKGLTVVVTG